MLSLMLITIEFWRTCITIQVNELKLVTIEQKICDFSSFPQAMMSAFYFLGLLLSIFKVLVLTSGEITPDGKSLTSLSDKSKWSSCGISMNVSEWIDLTLWPRMMIVCNSLNHSLANLMIRSSFVNVFAISNDKILGTNKTKLNFIDFTKFHYVYTGQ